jgi:hypothetical protein
LNALVVKSDPPDSNFAIFVDIFWADRWLKKLWAAVRMPTGNLLNQQVHCFVIKVSRTSNSAKSQKDKSDDAING